MRICLRHAVHPMMKMLAEYRRYTKSEREGTLCHLIWRYVDAETYREPDKNRKRLIETLMSAAHEFFWENWIPKEHL